MKLWYIPLTLAAHTYYMSEYSKPYFLFHFTLYNSQTILSGYDRDQYVNIIIMFVELNVLRIRFYLKVY
jgi:hypothetical protein